MEHIKGMRFSLTRDELRQLILDEAARLKKWLRMHPEADATLFAWRMELYHMLRYGAEHLSDTVYELERSELSSLFQTFED